MVNTNPPPEEEVVAVTAGVAVALVEVLLVVVEMEVVEYPSELTENFVRSMGVTEATLVLSTFTFPDTPLGMMLRVMVPTLGDQFSANPGQSLGEVGEIVEEKWCGCDMIRG